MCILCLKDFMCVWILAMYLIQISQDWGFCMQYGWGMVEEKTRYTAKNTVSEGDGVNAFLDSKNISWNNINIH